jgi:hypothetical protein
MIVGAAIISYSVQSLLLRSSTFIQSVDCIVTVVLNIIPTVLVLRRQPKLYENGLDDVKRYETGYHLDAQN